jgi:hypothetical protein
MSRYKQNPRKNSQQSIRLLYYAATKANHFPPTANLLMNLTQKAAKEMAYFDFSQSLLLEDFPQSEKKNLNELQNVMKAG